MQSPGVPTLVFLHQGAIGDFVLALSIVQATAARVRAARVVAIASASSAGLAAGRSIINQRLFPDQVGLHTLFGEGAAADRRLRELLADASYILSFLGPPEGPVHNALREATQARVISLDPRPSAETLDQRRHITVQWASDVAGAGFELTELEPPAIRMDLPAESTDDNRSNVIIHPGSGGDAKCWPLDRFMAVADKLQDCRVKWMLGPAECESDAVSVKSLRQRCDGQNEVLLIEEDFVKAVGHIAAADLYLGNDAGMTHVAAAMGIPTVAIYGPTDPAVWRPLGTHVCPVATPQPGMAIDAVPATAVIAAVHARLAQLS
ncbi:MAG TPA: glycosyltransferase family 9 protein [Phycisphaerae bacterium]|nr:glycosyltransferase family 9 protein [Phycisphaerae bacterium]HRR84936.1 glycosyltransferase family 9 protein [Phycisphaerae bacterium]